MKLDFNEVPASIQAPVVMEAPPLRWLEFSRTVYTGTETSLVGQTYIGSPVNIAPTNAPIPAFIIAAMAAEVRGDDGRT